MLWLNDSVRRYIPEAKVEATIGQLLTHTSGLPAASLYRSADPLQALWDLEPTLPPGKEVIYSCPGYIMLGEIVERISGRSLNELAKELLFDPLGMHDTQYTPPTSKLSRVAPTEFNAELGTHLHGVVHDNNCRSLGESAAMRGCSGLPATWPCFVKCGLTKEAMGVSKSFLRRSSKWRRQLYPGNESAARTGLAVESRLCGVCRRRSFSPESYGHTGFTGTCVWIDPTRELFLSLANQQGSLAS